MSDYEFTDSDFSESELLPTLEDLGFEYDDIKDYLFTDEYMVENGLYDLTEEFENK